MSEAEQLAEIVFLMRLLTKEVKSLREASCNVLSNPLAAISNPQSKLAQIETALDRLHGDIIKRIR